MQPETLDKILTNLRSIGNRLIGVMELSDSLDIDIVTDIFIHIYSKRDLIKPERFVMTKLASDENFGGNMLSKTIDYYYSL